MAFLLLSKKNSFEGNSSTIMGVSSSSKIHPALGVPFMYYRGVIEMMGLPISLDGFSRVTTVAGLFDGLGISASCSGPLVSDAKASLHVIQPATSVNSNHMLKRGTILI
jgi:hypothetical protein